MLEYTFCHLPGIREQREQSIWKQGVHTWSDFLSEKNIRGISKAKKPLLNSAIKASSKALFEGDATHFNHLPGPLMWRLWPDFQDEAAFIDIETNYRNQITVLGISNGTDCWQFLRHHNMDGREIKRVLSKFKLLVTFNGASFDLPIIKRYFNDVIPDVPHLDLRHAGRRAGLTGGLKRIEREVGISRGEDVEGVSGADALKLWSAYRATGETRYRDILLEYNQEDIINLKPLANIIYSRLEDQTRKVLRSSNT